jgi:hypothetical protein
MELASRRILHYGVTEHPTAEWTSQQFREALPGSLPYRFVIHDHDGIFSRELDQKVAAMGVAVMKTPVRAPQANARRKARGWCTAGVSGLYHPTR